MVGGLAMGGLALLLLLLLLLVLEVKLRPLGGGLSRSLSLPLAREGVPFLEKATVIGGSLCEDLLHQLLWEKPCAPEGGVY